jgi:hypothetical protein
VCDDMNVCRAEDSDTERSKIHNCLSHSSVIIVASEITR